ncbi:glutamate ABC transporter substrate-binding protein [Embleya sp. NBC_00896]|uniref:glutamate ABC transporter substrate-binding protein n=1 Tax=Embleya sp. NBC_00896 TaxID=2975961 RepID=UPI003863B9AE|nr:glutamate ABC transporter substrate-binding protein [Embleya sp. NBC_00896]
MHSRIRRIVVAASAGVLATTLAACSGSATGRPAEVGGPRGPEPPVSGARPATPEDYPRLSTAPACDPRRSLTPPATLPAPGRMPAGSTMETIRTRGYLIVGVDQNTRFFAELNRRSHEIEGFDIDMAKALAKAIFGTGPDGDERIRYKVVTQAQRIAVLTTGQVDVVIDTMTITCARKQQVAFSSDYYTDGQRVLVRYDSGVTGLAQLRGKRVCTVRATTSIAFLRDDPAGVLPYAVDNWTDCLVALQQGEVDAISTTSALLAGLRAQDPDTEVVGRPFTDEPHGMAFPLANQDFVRFANGLLERMKRDGSWQALYDRWLAGPLGAQPPPAASYAD